MKNIQRSTQILGRAALVALLAAPSLGAQGRWEDRDRNDDGWEDRDRRDSRERARDRERQLFTWGGTVDREARIVVHGRDVQTQMSRTGGTYNRGRVSGERALPRRDGYVRIQVLEGRGRVFVVQQPTARNDYTAILRVSDQQGGADRYRFVAYFDPADVSNRNGRGPIWGDSSGDDVYGQQRVMRWSGSIDGDTRISLQRGQIGYRVVTGGQPQNVRSAFDQSLDRRSGQLTVTVRQGRGLVQVVEQPSSWNNYTAVVRVLDGPGGYGHYDFDLLWQ